MATKQAPKTITFIKRTSLPVATAGRGVVATEPKLTIRNNGQMAFNSFIAKALGEVNFIGAGWLDQAKRRFAIQAFDKLPEGYTAEELFKPGKNSKMKGLYFGAGGLLTEAGYDYKASGERHIFTKEEVTDKNGKTFGKIVVKEGEKMIIFTLPEGALTPVDVPKRAPRKAKAAAAAAGGSTTAPASTVDGPADNDEDVELESEDEE